MPRDAAACCRPHSSGRKCSSHPATLPHRHTPPWHLQDSAGYLELREEEEAGEEQQQGMQEQQQGSLTAELQADPQQQQQQDYSMYPQQAQQVQQQDMIPLYDQQYDPVNGQYLPANAQPPQYDLPLVLPQPQEQQQEQQQQVEAPPPVLQQVQQQGTGQQQGQQQGQQEGEQGGLLDLCAVDIQQLIDNPEVAKHLATELGMAEEIQVAAQNAAAILKCALPATIHVLLTCAHVHPVCCWVLLLSERLCGRAICMLGLLAMLQVGTCMAFLTCTVLHPAADISAAHTLPRLRCTQEHRGPQQAEHAARHAARQDGISAAIPRPCQHRSSTSRPLCRRASSHSSSSACPTHSHSGCHPQQQRQRHLLRQLWQRQHAATRGDASSRAGA
jgi:hypothetical protein